MVLLMKEILPGEGAMVAKKRGEGFVEMFDGVKRQSLIWGERTHMVKFLLQKGKEIPLHTHQHEQTGYLLGGRMVMQINGKDYELAEGDSWSIKSMVPHGVRVLDDCTVLEVFSPVREDYR